MENEKNIKKKKNRKRNKKKALWISLICMFILAIFAGNRAAAFQWKLQGTLSLLDRKVDDNTIEDVEAQLAAAGSDAIKSDEIINILLVGADKRESWSEQGRSDSCMIATIDLKHKELKLTSLMRDMYVEIPGHGKNKFNASYSNGGVELLYKTILSNFGISVQGYAIVDFAAFKNVINTLGGVEIELTDAEHAILMKRYHRTSVLDLKPGKNNMNGTQALAYCRIRQIGRSDFDRTERQRKVLQQVFTKMKSKSISKWYETLEAVLPEVSTDLSNDEIFKYMKDVIFMGTTEIEQFRLPIDGSYTDIDTPNGDALDIDLETNREALKDFIFGNDKQDTKQDAEQDTAE